MNETPESDKDENSQLTPQRVPSPKRGAIPTPRAEIEKAKPYIPGTVQEGDKSPTEPVPPKEAGHREEGIQEEINNP
jgi:hypothetical protein